MLPLFTHGLGTYRRSSIAALLIMRGTTMSEIQKLDLLLDKICEITKYLGILDSKFNALDTKVSALDSKVNSLDSKVNSLDSKVSALDSKVSSLEAKQNKMADQLNVLEVKQNKMSEQLTEIQLSQKFFEFNTNKKLARLQDGMDTIEEILKLNGLIPV